MAGANHLLNMGVSFGCFDETVGHVCTRNREPETWQAALSYPIPSREGLVSESGRANNSPIKTAVNENTLHRSCVGNDTRKEQPMQQIMIGLRDRQTGPESGQDCVVIRYCGSHLVAIEQTSGPDCDLIAQRLE